MAEGNYKPYKSYDEYMGNVFDCVNRCLYQYLEGMKGVYANGQGGYKNVLYPDLEVASDSTREQMQKFSWVLSGSEDQDGSSEGEGTAASDDSGSSGSDDGLDAFGDLFGDFGGGGDSSSSSDSGDDMDELMDIFGGDADLLDVFSSFGSLSDDDEEETSSSGSGATAETAAAPQVDTTPIADVAKRILDIQGRAKATVEAGISMPFYTLCEKMAFDPFTVFCFACGIISSTQTDYAGVFQIVNENGGLSTPTIESAGKLYYGNKYSITGAYGDMSVCLEQMQPILDLRVVPSMP
ncbi:MAG: hypothetical protein K5853_09535, partial [Lachnospiraceae bacterium]|nr:hypothetical protein [Lachnospiraceae bacterium]